jgi:hypothetical protein
VNLELLHLSVCQRGEPVEDAKRFTLRRVDGVPGHHGEQVRLKCVGQGAIVEMIRYDGIIGNGVGIIPRSKGARLVQVA